MSVQTVILIMLCYYYNGVITGALLFPIVYSVFVYVLTCGMVPIDIHTKLQFAVMPIVSFSKVSLYLMPKIYDCTNKQIE